MIEVYSVHGKENMLKWARRFDSINTRLLIDSYPQSGSRVERNRE